LARRDAGKPDIWLKLSPTEAKLIYLHVRFGCGMLVGDVCGCRSRTRTLSFFKGLSSWQELEGGCIIFMMKLDAVGAQRSMDRGFVAAAPNITPP